MFDILSDEWKHPGAANSPIPTVDLSTEHDIGALRRCGFDVVLLTASGEVSEEMLDTALDELQKRFMFAYVDEKLILSLYGCTDEAFLAYNPMFSRHTLRTAPKSEAALTPFEEIVCENEDTLVIQTPTDGIDFLCPEYAESLIYGAYTPFIERYGEKNKCMIGTVSRRLTELSDGIFWTYDMAEVFFSQGGTPDMLVTLLTVNDRRRLKEPERLYKKTLAAVLEASWCGVMHSWHRQNLLTRAGDVPTELLAVCSGYFDLPVVSPETEFSLTVRCAADVARAEGGIGAALRSSARNADELMREAEHFAAASGSQIFLSDGFRVSRPEDMKDVSRRIKRLTSLGVACKRHTGTAVLVDVGYIPFEGAAAMTAAGADFCFISKDQIFLRSTPNDGTLSIDKFTFDTLVIEPRVRLNAEEEEKLASFGITTYRGSVFGDYAKKHLDVSPFRRDNNRSFEIYETYKCGHRFILALNVTDTPQKIVLPDDAHTGFKLDVASGEITPVCGAGYRVLPMEAAVFAWDSDTKTEDNMAPAYTVREIIALKRGENEFDYVPTDGDRVSLEIDSTEGEECTVLLEGGEAFRIVCPPYSKIIGPRAEKNTLIIDGVIRGAILRIETIKE